MTQITVDPGACRFICSIEAEKTGKYQVSIRFESQCKQIKKFAEEVEVLDFLAIMQGSFAQNPIGQAAARCGLHLSCPIPCALIKIVEVELGMAVQRKVVFSFGCNSPA